MMNKFKTKLDTKLQLNTVIQTVIDVAIPETELTLDNYKVIFTFYFIRF